MFKKTYNSIIDLIKDIALLKFNRTKSRGTSSILTESSKDVYANSCAEIAARFVDLGFSYAKSMKSMTKREKNVKYIVSFHSSSYNIKGKYVLVVC